MEIVIDIDDKVYGLLKYFEKGLGLNDKKDNNDNVKTALMRAVINGIPLERYEYRQKMFSYLDGVADGLNESSRDTIDVLDKVRAEICEVAWDSNYGEEIAKDMVVDLTDALTIIDKYREPTGAERGDKE